MKVRGGIYSNQGTTSFPTDAENAAVLGLTESKYSHSNAHPVTFEFFVPLLLIIVFLPRPSRKTNDCIKKGFCRKGTQR